MNKKSTILELKRQYQKEWRKKNPDKVKKNQENYWKRKAEKLIAEQNKEKEM